MKKSFLLIFMSLIIFTGCDEGACCGGNKLVQTKGVIDDISDTVNQTPIATMTKLPSSIVDCNNAKVSSDLSYDIDGTIESYIWSVDGVNISEEANPGFILPCENSKTQYQVCLTVVDNEGASSNKTCQTVNIVTLSRNNPEPIVPSHVVPNIKIPTPFRDGNHHVFDICEQTFDEHIVDSYHWQVTKHFKDGATATHTNDTCQKRIYARVKEFESIDVTLTINFSDGDIATTTSSYIQSDDAQVLDDD